MFTATEDRILPTTVTGSWPRPAWFSLGLWGRTLSDGMRDIAYREQLTDALSAVISDQERAGLDIVTTGDFHLDPDLGGQSWVRYFVERLDGVSPRDADVTSDEWAYRPGTLIGEVFGGWRHTPVIDEIRPGLPLEYAKMWRIAQARTDLPVKFGTVSSQIAASMIDVNTPRYEPDKRKLMWDMASVMNAELRALAAAGCKVIQVESPIIHFVAATSGDEEYIDFLVDVLNYEISGLEDVEVWIHTCWGNPNMQRVLDRNTYAFVIDTYLERVKGDVWTVEMKDRDFANLDLFRPYRDRMRKKVALGVVSHRALQADLPEQVADDIRYALQFIAPENLVLTSDCGFGRQGFNRLVAFYKTTAIAQGANLVRTELGLEPTPIRAANLTLQVDVPSSFSDRSLTVEHTRRSPLPSAEDVVDEHWLPNS